MSKILWRLWLLCLSPAIVVAGDVSQVKTVFIILMENHNWSSIKGSADAPYINNTLLPMASYCSQYYNPPGLHPSEPNYLWLEAGTNFGIRNDSDPSANHQRSTNHLVTLLKNAGISWKTYQEDISGTYVPLTATNRYVPRHNPFVYFDDVTGTNNTSYAYGIAHIRPYSELAGDLSRNTMARYNFLTPNLCNDSHDTCAPVNNSVRQGDNWLAAEVPKILNSQAYKNGGALFITWDEGAGSSDGPIGMIVLSPLARGGGYTNNIRYTHGSTLRTFQEIFGVTPFLGDAARAADLSDLFTSLPIARCKDMTVAAGPNCLANASIDNGSFDPDADAIAITQLPRGPYPVGTNQVRLIVTDSHGASNSCTAQVIVQDRTPPSISCPGLTVHQNDPGECGAVVHFALPAAGDTCSQITNVVCDPPSGSFFPIGITLVQCTAADAAGNIATCTFPVQVSDTEPPAIQCPSNIIVTNAHDSLTSVVAFNVGVSDNCPGMGPIVCNPASGSTLGIGTHPVTCAVMDAAHNASQCSFSISVLPGNQPPVPVIEISPLAKFPGITNLLLIAPDNGSVAAVLDGSKSYDPDDAVFNFLWTDGTNLLSTSSITTNWLAIGNHDITLALDDTFPLGTNSATVTIQVISASTAVGIVKSLVVDASVAKNLRPLLATLEAAAASFERGGDIPGINQLEAFQNKVRAQIIPIDSDLGAQLINAAQVIIDALEH